MDNSFEQIKKISMQFGMREIILPQSLRRDINARMELMEQLRELLLLIPNVDEIIFWMPGQELFYSSQSSYSVNSYLNLYQLDLEKGNINKAQIVIHDITFQMERIQYKPIICKTVCYEIANIISKADCFIGEQTEIQLLLNQFLVHLNQVQTRMEILDLLNNLGNDLNANHGAQNEKDKDINQIEGILEYISTNYMDSSFYLGEVASRFGISQNNLSQQLKRALGVSPNKYINTLRVDDAKHLLVDTDLSIKDIACKVGFSDASSFIRNFKVVTSATPSAYRSVHSSKI